MVGQHPGQHRHPHEQEGEDAQEAVVGDERRLAPALVVAVLLDHRVREAQHAMLALHTVRPGDDPVHQAGQAFEVHGSSLPGSGAPPLARRATRDAEDRAAGGAGRRLSSYCGCRIPSGGQPAGWPEHTRSGPASMISLQTWWWPKRPARVPGAWTAGLLAGLGAVLFGVSAVLLKTG